MSDPVPIRGETGAREWIEALNKFDLETAVFYVEEHVNVVGVEQWLGLLPPSSDEEIEDLRNLIYSITARSAMMPGRQLASALHDGRRNVLSPIEWTDANDPGTGVETIHWQTGCQAIDEKIRGGYGMTVIAGAPKVGKSLLAISSAIEAARSGWSVVYANAEMSLNHILERMRNYCGTFDPAVGENLHLAQVGPGITIDKLYEEIEREAIEDDTDKLLIVLDSINRITDFSASGETEGSYWQSLQDWSAWAMNSRRSTEGRISWLIVSELNQRGDVKGLNLQYTADLVIRMSASEAPDVAIIDIPYSRATRAEAVGPTIRDFQTGRFIQHG